MDYAWYQAGSHIEVELDHGNSEGPWRNKVIVKGTDSIWVNGVIRTIQEILEGFTPQNTFVRRRRVLLTILSALGIGLVFMHVLTLSLSFIPIEPSSDLPNFTAFAAQHPFAARIVVYLFFGVFGSLPGGILTDKLQSFWPSVELQIGPEHKFAEKRRRIWLLGSITVGLVPLCLQLIYDIIKYIIIGKT
jgi:hypothetical protein